MQEAAEGAEGVFHVFVLELGERDAMAAAGGRPGTLPVSEALCREVLCVPLYPELPFEALERVAAQVQSFCGAAVAR
jgi:dTDP-4-amino-4,6-dideoxygalactose transaminase